MRTFSVILDFSNLNFFLSRLLAQKRLTADFKNIKKKKTKSSVVVRSIASVDSQSVFQKAFESLYSFTEQNQTRSC